MNKETINNLLEYLQFKIDCGQHKLFYNDLDWDVKTIDCINALNDLKEKVEKLTQENNDLESKYQSKNDEYIKAMLKICDLQEENEYLKEHLKAERKKVRHCKYEENKKAITSVLVPTCKNKD